MDEVGRTRELSDLEWLIEKAGIVLAAWKLVLFGSAVLTAAGVAAVFLTLQPAYLSRMVLPLSPNIRALIKTEAILDPVVRATHLAAEASDIAIARHRLAGNLVLSSELSPGSGVYALTITDPLPQRAQTVLEQVLAQVLSASKPRGTALADALHQIETLKRTTAELQALAQALNDNASHVKAGAEGELYARALAVLVADIAAKENRMWQLQNGLEGLRPEDVLLRPTLATLSEPTALLGKLSFVLVGASLLMIAFVLLRHEWRKRRHDLGASVRFRDFDKLTGTVGSP